MRFTTKVYGGPVHYLDSEGRWQEIKVELVSHLKGRYRNAANFFELSFSNNPLDSQLATIKIDSTHSISWGLDAASGLSGLSSLVGIALGNRMTYSSILPNVDLRLTSTKSGVKEDLILRSKAATNVFTFPLELTGLSAETDSSGDVIYRDETGAIRARTPHGMAEDSNYDDRKGEGARTYNVTYDVVQHSVSQRAIRVTVDRAWLDDPSRVFPVMVDPTNYVGDGRDWGGDDAFVMSAYPNNNYNVSCCSGSPARYEDKIGYYDSTTGTNHTFLHYNLSPLNGKVIHSGIWNGFFIHSYYFSTYTNYWLRPMNGGWCFTCITWNNQPGVKGDNIVGSAVRNTWQSRDMTTWVYNWTHWIWGQDGIRIDTNGNGQTYWKKLASFENTDGSDSYIQVDWSEPNNPPYAPDSPNPNGITVTSQPPTLNARFSDPDGNNGYVHFRLYDASNAVIAEGDSGWVCNGCTASWTAPTLTNGSYSWDAYASDGSLNSGWNGRWYFTMGQPPTVTKTVSPSQATYSRGQAVTYTITVTNPQSTSMVVTSVQDAVPSALAPAGSTFTSRLGTGATLPCAPATVPSCLLNGQSFSTSQVTLSAGQSITFTLNAIAIGSERECSTETNTASASNQYNTGTGSVSMTVCEAGLGLERWWSYVTRPVGPMGAASVNVANGNLVVQQTDSTPIQAHGRLSHVLRRTYNAQESTILTLPGSIGAGWRLSIGEADDLLGDVLGTTALYVPSAVSAVQPLAVTFVDRDGTRHVFRLKVPSVPPIDVQTLDPQGVLGTLVPKVLSVDTANFRLCVEQAYTAPPGVQLGLWRYVKVAAGVSCSNSPAGGSLVGFAAVRPDRVRYEFSTTGQLLSMSDGSGVEFEYLYDAQQRLITVYEPRSCANPADPLCRATRFTYVGELQTDVLDPAGRTTSYIFDTAIPKRLVQVRNPDGSVIDYTYGAANCTGAASNQLCSVTDPRGATTRFTYSSNPAPGGLPRVASIVDRNSNTTTVNYGSSITSDQGSQRRRFLAIDSTGRVGEIDEGTTGDVYLHQTLYTWDAPGAICRQPDAVVDNNLCRVVRESFTADTPDEDSSFVYNSEGRLIKETRANGAAPSITTFGHRAQYFQAGGTVRTFDDTVAGSGNVTSQSLAGSLRSDDQTLFFISDMTQRLTARGNGPGTGFAPFLTTYRVDNNTSVSPSATPATNLCLSPTAPATNTGSVCEEDGPSFDGINRTKTRYTYDTFGQKITKTTPKAIAETAASLTPPAYRYAYYADSDRSFTGATSAGGWLKGVTDPAGNFVAFAYDEAGNVVRTWDRNATKGHLLAEFPGLQAAPPSSAYTETLYKTAAMARPWRYLRSMRDQLGNLATYLVDANGNRTRITPPRGNTAGNTNFDVVQTFDANDNLLSNLMPEQSASNKPTRYTYDQFGNQTAVTDPRGSVTVSTYDSVNRPTGKKWTRGPWPADTSEVPTACRQSTASDAPISSGRILCSTSLSYDGVDNVTSASDGNAQVTTFTFDALHREIKRLVPRSDGTFTTLRTDSLYDRDGNITDVCPPREFSEGSASCTSTGLYSQHFVYDAAGRRMSATTFRAATGETTTTVATNFSYDADGNPVTVTDPNGRSAPFTYDLLDRKMSVNVPRATGVTNTTTWSYDPSGNVTAIVRPGSGTLDGSFDSDPLRQYVGRITAYGYDPAHRLIDSVAGADNPDAGIAGAPAANGGTNVRTRVIYDPDGNVVARFDPRAFAASTASPDPRFMVRTDYDRNGRPTAQYVPRYDGTTSSDPGISTTQTSQCPTGADPQPVPGASVPAYPSDVGGCVTRASYDDNGNLSRLTLPTSSGSDNRFVATSYTDDNLALSVDSPSPQTDGARVTSASYLYDGNAKPIKVKDALGHQSTTSYFPDGLMKQVVGQPNGTNTHQTSYGYDANGNSTSVTDPVGNISRTSYFSDNLVRESIDGGGGTTRYSFDANGNPIQVKSPSAVAADATNPSGTPTINTFTFDNLISTTTVPVAGDGSSRRRITYGYDAGGRKISQKTSLVNAAGTQTSDGGTQAFTYFPNDQLAAESGRSATDAFNGTALTYTYDASGNQTSATTNEAGSTRSTIAATYYLDSLTRTVDDTRDLTRYAYNGSGAVVARRFGSDWATIGTNTTYSYGDAGLPKTMASGHFTGTIGFNHDQAGRPASETHPSGETLSFGFNPDDTLSSLAVANSSGTSTFSYTYDKNYRITSQGFSGPGAGGATPVTSTFSYGYDPAGRLSSFTDQSGTRTLSWDKDGNRLSFGADTFTYNADATIKTATSQGTTANYIYDTVGRMASDTCNTFTYDGFDRLQRTKGQTATGCPTPVDVSYNYDPLGRQVWRSQTGGLNPTSTLLYYDGLSDKVAETFSSASDNTDRALGPQGETKLVAHELSSTITKHFLADDGQGNISLATTTSGTVACTARFDPFGSPASPLTSENPCNTGATPSDVFYRGARRDGSTGQYQFGDRIYDPKKAAFLTPDSYRAADPGQDLSVGVDPLTMNRYSYVNGDPVNLIDPDGHKAKRRRRGFTFGDIGGFFKGVGEGAWGTAKGLGTLAVGTGKFIYRGTVECARGRASCYEQAETIEQTTSYIKRRKLGVIKDIGAAATEEIRADWKQGNEGEAAGRVVTAIVEAVVGTKGLTKLSKLGKFRAPRAIGSTADDWWRVSNVGRSRAGTLVPESFDLSVAGQKFAVHPNATKHMAEYATSHGGSVPFSSFAGSVERAVQGGLQSGRNFVRVGPWELGIDTRGNVIYHAVYMP